MKAKFHVRSVIFMTMRQHALLTMGILTTVVGAVVTSLFPPLLLGKIVDTITAGNSIVWTTVLLYFTLLALTGVLGILPRSPAHRIRSENYARPPKPDDGQIHRSYHRSPEPSGTWRHGIPICGRCRHSGKPLYLRNYQYGC